MRHRVEFAYEKMNLDIYYEGGYRYTVENHNNKQVIKMLSEEQVDHLLNKMWSDQLKVSL